MYSMDCVYCKKCVFVSGDCNTCMQYHVPNRSDSTIKGSAASSQRDTIFNVLYELDCCGIANENK